MNIYRHNNKKVSFRKLTFLLLSYPDSNQDKQNQNLLCYHYTIGQSSLCSLLKSGDNLCNDYLCKDRYLKCKCQIISVVSAVTACCGLNGESVDCVNNHFNLVVAHGLVARQAKAAGMYLLGYR